MKANEQQLGGREPRGPSSSGSRPRSCAPTPTASPSAPSTRPPARADDIVAEAKATAERIRTESERELCGATQRRDSINAQLTNVRQMLATLTGASLPDPIGDEPRRAEQPRGGEGRPARRRARPTSRPTAPAEKVAGGPSSRTCDDRRQTPSTSRVPEAEPRQPAAAQGSPQSGRSGSGAATQHQVTPEKSSAGQALRGGRAEEAGRDAADRAERAEAGAERAEARADAPRPLREDAEAGAEHAEARAEEAEADGRGGRARDPLATPRTRQFGRLGRPIRRDSPFMLGFLGALGVFVAYFLVQAVVQARSVIILIVVALFLAIGLSPIVEWLIARGIRRGFAIAIVFVGVIGAFVGFGFAVLPPVIEQSNAFVQESADTCADLRSNRTIRSFDDDYGLIDRAQTYVQSGDLGTSGCSAGSSVWAASCISAVFSAFSLLIMTLYFLAALPSMKRQAYRLVPATRRERVTLLSDEVINRIGGFISGALAGRVHRRRHVVRLPAGHGSAVRPGAGRVRRHLRPHPAGRRDDRRGRGVACWASPSRWESAWSASCSTWPTSSSRTTSSTRG